MTEKKFFETKIEKAADREKNSEAKIKVDTIDINFIILQKEEKWLKGIEFFKKLVQVHDLGKKVSHGVRLSAFSKFITCELRAIYFSQIFCANFLFSFLKN